MLIKSAITGAFVALVLATGSAHAQFQPFPTLTFPTSPFLNFPGAPTFGGLFPGLPQGTIPFYPAPPGLPAALTPFTNTLFQQYGDPFSPTCPGFFCR